MEMVTIVKANALAKIAGNEVWIVVTDAKSVQIRPLEGVHLIDFGVNYYTDYYGLKGFYKKQRLHKVHLEKLLNEIRPDVVVATAKHEKNFFSSLRLPSKPFLIREMHSEKHYCKKIKNITLRQKVSDWIATQYDYHWKIKAYDYIVVLTEEDKEQNWKGCRWC